MGELSERPPDKTIDLKGRVCPYPLVISKNAIEEMQSGQVLKILCDAPPSAEDTIPRWAEKRGYKFEVIKLGEEGSWELFIEKK
jgi:tRNA 2-thiouridine synthesizing protein A